MSRALMRRRCPGARIIGPSRLDGFRFVITRAGYASVVPRPGGVVHGLLWRLTPRDLAALNAYEQRAYRRRFLPVERRGRRVPALVYVAPPCGGGRPRPGYQELVVAAARAADLPGDYVRALDRLVPGFHGALTVATGEMG